ncbi:MAG: class I SAM-dependent methyltransferase [Actinomycetota bacterium]
MSGKLVPPRVWDDGSHAEAYLDTGLDVPHRIEGEQVLLECLGPKVRRILDLGAGDGRILAMTLDDRPGRTGVALDHNPHMLHAATSRFTRYPHVEIVDHDLARPLPALGTFDAVVSALALHHLGRERRRRLLTEIHGVLTPGGVFADLDLVRSGSEALHDRFIQYVPWDRAPDRPWDRHPSAAEREFALIDTGFHHVDCVWKWRELALVVGERPPQDREPQESRTT